MLGAHRSGHSVLGEYLRQLGFDVGDDGAAHDRLYADLGQTWSMIGGLPEGWMQSQPAQDARAQFAEVVQSRFKGPGRFVIQDPRLCRLAPLWLQVLDDAGLAPSLLLLIRHPSEVAASLEACGAMDCLTAHLFWAASCLEALQACAGRNFSIITYEQLMEDPAGSLGKSLGALVPGMQPLPVPARPLRAPMASERRHHAAGSAGAPAAIVSACQWLYAGLQALQAHQWRHPPGAAQVDGTNPGEALLHFACGANALQGQHPDIASFAAGLTRALFSLIATHEREAGRQAQALHDLTTDNILLQQQVRNLRDEVEHLHRFMRHAETGAAQAAPADAGQGMAHQAGLDALAAERQHLLAKVKQQAEIIDELKTILGALGREKRQLAAALERHFRAGG